MNALERRMKGKKKKKKKLMLALIMLEVLVAWGFCKLHSLYESSNSCISGQALSQVLSLVLIQKGKSGFVCSKTN